MLGIKFTMSPTQAISPKIFREIISRTTLHERINHQMNIERVSTISSYLKPYKKDATHQVEGLVNSSIKTLAQCYILTPNKNANLSIRVFLVFRPVNPLTPFTILLVAYRQSDCTKNCYNKVFLVAFSLFFF
jgi:hypothetical protein